MSAKTLVPVPRHKPHGRRRSPFSNGKSLRQIERASLLQQHLNEHDTHLTVIDIAFADLEEKFIEERKAVAANPHPPAIDSHYDSFMLQIRRDELSDRMLKEARRRYHAYITKRSKQTLELPPVVDVFRVQVNALVEQWEAAHE